MKSVIDKVYKISGSDEKLVRLFMYACTVFIAIVNSIALMNLNASRSFEIINIFPSYYLIYCMNKYRENERVKIYATIPITKQIVSKYEFKIDIPRYILWVVVVGANNIVYLINKELYYGRGVLGMLFIVSAIMLIFFYNKENAIEDKKKIFTVIYLVGLIFLLVMYLACMFASMIGNAKAVYGVLNKIFGAFAGYPAMVISIIVVVGIIIHFYGVQSKKKGAWG